jgi:8-oxo-dGTP pyrophosphatase MutT (NUDIX family)
LAWDYPFDEMMTYYKHLPALYRSAVLYDTIPPVKILTEIYYHPGINIQGRAIHRIAVRTVILRGRDLLMVHSANVGDYKFPGGGVNEGESYEQALARELREECGASLLSVDGELGAVIEYNIPMEAEFDVFKMTSYYYFCQTEDGFGAQKLDDYERDLGFKPVWVNIDDAISANHSLLDSQTPPNWLRREIFVLEHLRQAL